ncbi:MAG TPA: hypothetical protein VIG58_00070, partial [Corynebacterium sp.]
MATTPSGSHPNGAGPDHDAAPGGGSDEPTATREDVDVARGSGDGAGAPRPRVFLLVFAIIIGLLVAAIPLVAGVMSGGDDQPGAHS